MYINASRCMISMLEQSYVLLACGSLYPLSEVRFREDIQITFLVHIMITLCETEYQVTIKEITHC